MLDNNALAERKVKARLLCPQTCGKCQLRKGLDSFSPNRARLDGMCTYCKPCNALASKERRRLLVPVTEPTVTHKVI